MIRIIPVFILLLCQQIPASWDFGAAASDRINTSTAQSQALRSYSVWTWRDGLGGGNLGAVFTGAADSCKLQINSGTTMTLTMDFSTTDGVWRITLPGTGGWHHIAATYDSGNVANDPAIYVDGVTAPGFVETVTPVGTFTPGGNVIIGNLNSNTRNWDGRIAEFAMWNRILSASEVAGLAKGASPMAIPSGLTSYIPMIRDLRDWKVATVPVATGAVAFDTHPDVFYPTVARVFDPTAGGSAINVILSNQNRRRRQ